MPRCRVNGCANTRAGHSRLCNKHRSRKRRHGHEEQRTVSKADLKPFVESPISHRPSQKARLAGFFDKLIYGVDIIYQEPKHANAG
jgi:hypothetical protein